MECMCLSLVHPQEDSSKQQVATAGVQRNGLPNVCFHFSETVKIDGVVFLLDHIHIYIVYQ